MYATGNLPSSKFSSISRGFPADFRGNYGNFTGFEHFYMFRGKSIQNVSWKFMGIHNNAVVCWKSTGYSRDRGNFVYWVYGNLFIVI